MLIRKPHANFKQRGTPNLNQGLKNRRRDFTMKLSELLFRRDNKDVDSAVLKKQIDALTQKRCELEANLASLIERKRELEVQRQQHLVSALADEDSAALKERARIKKILDEVSQDETDLLMVIEEVRMKVEKLELGLAEAHNSETRKELESTLSSLDLTDVDEAIRSLIVTGLKASSAARSCDVLSGNIGRNSNFAGHLGELISWRVRHELNKVFPQERLAAHWTGIHDQPVHLVFKQMINSHLAEIGIPKVDATAE
jgi:hypothetical protein